MSYSSSKFVSKELHAPLGQSLWLSDLRVLRLFVLIKIDFKMKFNRRWKRYCWYCDVNDLNHNELTFGSISFCFNCWHTFWLENCKHFSLVPPRCFTLFECILYICYLKFIKFRQFAWILTRICIADYMQTACIEVIVKHKTICIFESSILYPSMFVGTIPVDYYDIKTKFTFDIMNFNRSSKGFCSVWFSLYMEFFFSTSVIAIEWTKSVCLLFW